MELWEERKQDTRQASSIGYTKLTKSDDSSTSLQGKETIKEAKETGKTKGAADAYPAPL
jgi:hypothetical protein